jgi:hypothetical protein
MSSTIVTLRSPLLQRAVDLELPGEVLLKNLLPELVRVLQLPSTDSAGQPIAYQLVQEAAQRPLREAQTLLSAGVVRGEVLSLVSTGSQIGAGPGGAGGGSVTSALLRCESGLVIALDNYGKAELIIGRYDAHKGESVDIDLSEEPEGSTVSRSHALLRKKGDQWTLVSLSTKNPTRVGETKLAPQQSRPLKPGDTITLGAVKLVFETGRSF